MRHISSEHDMEEVRADLDTIPDNELLTEANLYERFAAEEAAEGNWYASDLYTDAAKMFRGEYLDRQVK